MAKYALFVNVTNGGEEVIGVREFRNSTEAYAAAEDYMYSHCYCADTYGDYVCDDDGEEVWEDGACECECWVEEVADDVIGYDDDEGKFYTQSDLEEKQIRNAKEQIALGQRAIEDKRKQIEKLQGEILRLKDACIELNNKIKKIKEDK